MNLRRFIALFLALTMIFSLAFPGGFAFADDDIVYIDDAANDEEELDDALEEEYAQDEHIHNLTYYPEAAASCAAPGNYECWYCADCGKFYADEACEYEVAFEELAIPATDEHSFLDGTCAVCGAEDPDYVAPAAVMLASALEETVVEETNDEMPVAETVIEEKADETPVAETVVEETVGEARSVESAENTDAAKPSAASAESQTTTLTADNTPVLGLSLQAEPTPMLGALAGGETAVAKIGNEEFASIADAVAAAQSGDIITLLSDVALTSAVEVPAEANIVLDLAGHSITGTVDDLITIKSGAMLTINDSSNPSTGAISTTNYTVLNNSGKLRIEGGSFSTVNNGGGTTTVYNKAGGTLTISGGNFSTIATNNGNDNGFLIANEGKVLITGGSFSATADRYAAAVWSGGEDAETTIEGGSISVNGKDAVAVFGYAGAKVEIKGGTISATGNEAAAVQIQNIANVNITGGTITADSTNGQTAAVLNTGSSTINVSGDTAITADGNQSSAILAISGEVDIAGGTITGKIATDSGEVEISGGTLDNTAYSSIEENSNITVDPAFEPKQNTNGTWTVSEKPAVKIETEDAEAITFAALADSWEASYNDHVITLNKDVSTKRLYLLQDITIDLNGHTLTAGDDDDDRGFYICENSTLTLKDSSTGGKLIHNKAGGIAIYVRAGGKLIVKNGIFGVGGNFVYNNTGSVEVEGGVFTVGTSNVVIWNPNGTAVFKDGIVNVTRDTIKYLPEGKTFAEITSGEYQGYFQVADIIYSQASLYNGETLINGSLTLAEAIQQAQPGNRIVLSEGEADLPATAVIPEGVTIQGAGKDQTTLKITTTTGSGVTINNANVTIKDVTIDGSAVESGDYKTLINVRADGVVIDNVIMTGGGQSTWNSSILVETLPATATFTVRNSTISGSFRGVLRESCSANIVINNCEIDAVYPFNIDGGNGGTVTVTGGALHGWTSYSNVDKVTFNNVEFSEGNSGYNAVAAYVDTKFEECAFVTGDSEPFEVNAQTTGFNFTFNKCTKDGVEITDEYLPTMFSDSNVWSKCETAIDVETKDDGKYTSGTVVSSKAPECAENSVSLKTGTSTEGASVFKIGSEIVIYDPVSAGNGKYTVTLKLLKSDNSVIYKKVNQVITVEAASDVTITGLDGMATVVKNALDEAGAWATDVETVELSLDITSEGNTHTVVLKGTPKNGETSLSEEAFDIANTDFSGAEFSFTLPVTNIADDTNVKVEHKNSSTGEIYETFYPTVANGKVPVTVTHFSTFSVTELQGSGAVYNSKSGVRSASIADALSDTAFNSGDTLVLLADLGTADNRIAVTNINDDVIIDLHGSTIYATGTGFTVGAATLTLKDSGSNGALNVTTDKTAVGVKMSDADAVFNLESGSLIVSGSRAGRGIDISDGYEVTVTGGVINAGNNGIAINNSNITAITVKNEASLIGGNYAINNTNGGTATISSGYIDGKFSGNGITLSGGVYSVDPDADYIETGKISWPTTDDTYKFTIVPATTLTFDAGDGAFSGGSKTVSFAMPKDVETTFSAAAANKGYTLVDPAYYGHIFDGWFLGETKFDADAEITLTEATIYTAAWSEGVAAIGDTYYKTLNAAVSAAQSGQTVTLLTDVTEDLNFNTNKRVTLDLSDHTLIGAINQTAGNLIVNNGTIAGRVNVYGAASAGDPNRTFTLGENATIDSVYGIILWQVNNNCAYSTTINVNGTVHGNVWVMGNITQGDSTINIRGTVDATGKSDVGVALNGMATVNVYPSATVKSEENGNGTGIEVRSGTLNVYGGTITGTGAYSFNSNGSGTTSTGVGIAVAQHTTEKNIQVNISGNPVVSGTVALALANPETNHDGKLNVNVTNGTFNSTGSGNNAVAVVLEEGETRVNGFISGGTFSSPLETEYCATGYIPATIGSGVYSVGQGWKVTFDEKNNTDPVVVPVAKGARVEVPEDPTYADHTFVGWYNGQVRVENSFIPTADTIITAAWTQDNQYQVHIDNWTYGDTPSVPSVTYTDSNGNIATVPNEYVQYKYTINTSPNVYPKVTISNLSEAGEYFLSAKVSGFGTYTDTDYSAPISFRINPRPVTLTSESATKVYDTTALTNRDVVTVGGKGFVEGQGATYKATGIQTDVGSSENTFTYTLNNGTNPNNYTITTVNGTLTVTTKVVTEPTITFADGFNYTYDRTAKEPAIIVKDGNTVIPASEYTVSYSNNTNAGPATVTITDNDGGNYNVTGSTTFTIAKRPVTVTWTTLSVPYDGESHAPGFTTEGLLDADGYSVVVKTGEATSVVNAGTVMFTAEFNNNAATSNYTWAKSGMYQTDFTITKVPLTVTAKDHTITYGDEPANNGVEYSGFVNGEDANVLNITNLAYAYNYEQYGNVGSYTIKPSGITADNYAITYEAGTLTVSPKAITLTVDPATKIAYNGDPVFSVKAGENDLVNGDTVDAASVVYTRVHSGDDTLATDTVNAANAKIKHDDKDVTGNYNITYAPGTLTITPAVASVTSAGTTTYYATLEAAAAAAQSGDTITLVADAELTDRIWLASGVTLDGAGKTIKPKTDAENFFDPRLATDSDYAGKSSLTLINLANDVTDVTIKNVTLDSNNGYPRALIGTGTGTTLTIENVILNHTSTTIRGADALALNGNALIKGNFTVSLGERSWSAISFNTTDETLTFAEESIFTLTRDYRTGTQPLVYTWNSAGSQVVGATEAGLVSVNGDNEKTGFESVSNSTKLGTKDQPSTYNYRVNKADGSVAYYTTFALAAAQVVSTTGTVEMFAAPADTDTFALNEGQSLKVVKNGFTPVVKAVGEFEVKQSDVTTDGVTTTTYSLAAAVASITRGEGAEAVTSYYATLQGAVDAAQNGDTVKLLVDLKEDTALTSRVEVNAENKSFTIDLGGKTIAVTHTTGNGSAFDIKSGTVTIKNGTIDGTGVVEGANSNIAVADGICLVTVRGGATLNLTQAEGETLYMVVDSRNGSCVYPFSDANGVGHVYISGGTYENQTDEDYQWKTGFKGLTVNQANNQGQLIHITGGTFKGNDPQLGDDSNGARAVELGSVAMPANSTTAGQPGTYTVVSGGVVTFMADDVKFAEQRIAKDGKATKPATDPTKANYVFDKWVYGEQDTAWVFDTNTVTTDITLKATWTGAVASVTHTEGDTTTVTYFTELPKAVEEAVAGDTVTLLADVDLGSTPLTINKGIILDGQKNDTEDWKITSTANPAIMVNTDSAVTLQNMHINVEYFGNVASGVTPNVTVNNIHGDVKNRFFRTAGSHNGGTLTFTKCDVACLGFDPTTKPYTNSANHLGIFIYGVSNAVVSISNSTINGFCYDIIIGGGSSNNTITVNETTMAGRAGVYSNSGNNNTYYINSCTIDGYNISKGPTEGFACIVEDYTNSQTSNYDNKFYINGGTYNALVSNSFNISDNASEYLLDIRGQRSMVFLSGEPTYTINTPARGGLEGEIDLGTSYANAKIYLTPEAEAKIRSTKQYDDKSILERSSITVIDNTDDYAAEGYTRIIQKGTVVAIGSFNGSTTQYFYTVQEAIDYACQEGSTDSRYVRLYKRYIDDPSTIEENVVIPAGKTLTLCPASMNLKAVGDGPAITVETGAKLTLGAVNGASVANNRGIIATGNATAIKVEAGGVLTNKGYLIQSASTAIDSEGKVILESGTVNANGVNGVGICGSGVVEVKGGFVRATMAGATAIKVEDDAELTVSGEARVTASNATATAITLEAGGKATVSGGTVENTQRNGTVIIVNTDGELIVSGGLVTGKTGTVNTQTGIDNSGTVTISGGSINMTQAYDTGIKNNGTLNVTGGAVTAAGTAAVAVINNGTVKMTGGTVKATSTLSVYATGNAGVGLVNYGTAEISNGEISGPNGIYVKSGTVSVSGGTVTGTIQKRDYAYSDTGFYSTGDAIVVDSCGEGTPILKVSGSPELTAGTNASQIGFYEGKKSAEGWTLGKTIADTQYTLSTNGAYAWGTNPDSTTVATYPKAVVSAVASVTSGTGETAVTTYYATLQDAVDAAHAGDTVLLLSDINALTARVDVNKDLTIDLGGKTIKPTNASANGSAFNITAGTVEIKNGTLDGTGVDETADGNVTIANGICLVTVRSGATLNLTDDNLHMVVNSKNGSCVYPFAGGTVNISGGTYENQTTEAYQYKDGFKGLTVNQANGQGQLIHITGGTFIGNDPQIGDDSWTETKRGFVESEHVAVDTNGTYNVVPGYLVDFDTDGGEPATIAQQRIAKNGNATKPATDPTKAGFEFGGWYQVTDGTMSSTAYDFNSVVSTDITLKAKWIGAVASITRGEGDAAVTTYYATLQGAVNAAAAGDTIKLEAETVTVDPMILVDKTLTLDLNSKTLSGKTNTSSIFQIVNNATLTINGEGASVNGRINVGISKNDAVYKAHNWTSGEGNITLNGGTYACGSNQTVLHVNGECLASNVTIKNATITSADDNGIQLNGKGNHTIENSTITGKTAVYVKAGTVEISGSTLTSTAASHNAYNFNGNGANPTGDAIVVDSCAYPGGNPIVNLGSGNTITVASNSGNVQIGYYEWNTDKPDYQPGSVTSGTNVLTLPDGFSWLKTGENTYKISEAVAKIGNVYYATLADAIAAVPTDGIETTILMLKDNVSTGSATRTTAPSVDGGRNVVIDMANMTLVGALNVKNGSSLKLTNGTLENEDGQGVNVHAMSGKTTFTLDSNAIIKATYGIILREAANGAKSTINVDGTVNGNVWVIGSINSGDNTINVKGTILNENNGEDAAGLALQGLATANIESGAEITGKTGIEVRGGTLNVKDGATITGTGAPTSSQSNNNGTTTVGAGIAVSRYDINNISVIISGGTISGNTPLLFVNKAGTSEKTIEAEVTGGKFLTINDGTGSIVVDSSESGVSAFVSGEANANGDYVSGPQFTFPIADALVKDGMSTTGDHKNDEGLYYVVPMMTITVNPSDGEHSGTYEGKSETTTIKLPLGEAFSITAADVTAPEGYTLSGWTYELPDIVTLPIGTDLRVSSVKRSFNLTAQYTLKEYTITFVNDDDTVLQTVTVKHGDKPAYTGETPTKAADAQYTYTFAGWTPAIETATADATCKATYTTATNKYTVTYRNYDGTELQSSEVEYGATPTYTGEKPTKAADTQYTYTFTGWDTTVDTVTGNVTFTAQFDSTVNKYTVKFVNEDGDELQSSEVAYGTTPTYTGETPTKAADTQYTYTFEGWKLNDSIYTGSIPAVTGEATYTAAYTKELRTYTITFRNDNETVLATYNYSYGTAADAIAKPEATKAATEQYTYTFTGWNPAIVEVTGDATYTAQFVETDKEYTVTFDTDGGSEIAPITAKYNTKVVAPNDPTKDGSIFAGWFNGENEWKFDTNTVTEDVTLTAHWTEAVATINGTPYATLADAFAAANGETTIEVLKDSSGSGIIVPSGSNITVNFNNHTYTVANDPLAGSTGTKTQAFQLLKDSTIVFNNGAIVADNANVKMLIQNYAALTLNGMTLDATQGNNSVGYVLSTNNGSTKINDTSITAKPDGTAFDACSGWGGYAGNSVEVTGNSSIQGNIEVSYYGQEGTAPASLTLTSGTHSGAIVMAEGAEKTTVTRADTYTQTAPEGYAWVSNGNGTSTLKQIVTVTFELNGGTGTVEAQTIEKGAKATKPETDPTKEGYTFVGWFNGENEWKFDTNTVTEDVTLTAKWVSDSEMVKVSVTSSGDGTVTGPTVSFVTGGGTYIPGTQVTVTTTQPTGYRFKGWYKGGAAIEGATALECSITADADCELVAVFEPDGTAKFHLTVTGSKFKVNGGTEQHSRLDEDYAVNGTITLAFTGSEDFLYWINGSNKVVSKNPTYSFVLASDATYTAVYSDEKAKESALVVFVSEEGANGQVISSRYYAKNEAITKPNSPAKLGKVFSFWTVDGSTAVTDQDIWELMDTQSRVEVYPVYNNAGQTYTVTVVHVKADGTTVTDTETYAGKQIGTGTTITPNDEYGTFSYWSDKAADGEILSYESSYKVWSATDVTRYAIYDKTVTEIPTVAMTGISKSMDGEKYVVSLMMGYNVPSEYKLVRTGMLYANINNVTDPLKEMVIGSANTKVFEYRSPLTDASNTVILHVRLKQPTSDYIGRGYLIYQDNSGKTITIYSNNTVNGSYNTISG